ncbi:hypothetical protein NLG97_g1028 [Lecanicillium saksenae]|uniref:Uncharacterized protein n=1 Tax=Lecanicillium saksenae TaxID=468837 RepID=A0ACC1R7K6_9HYPO|nr:hypothetical protein NLG97_g1028 [Lecanicillium saksenae]
MLSNIFILLASAASAVAASLPCAPPQAHLQTPALPASGATGALAVLYDALPLYPKQGPRSLSADKFMELPGDGRVDPAHPGASPTEPFPAPAPLSVDGIDGPLEYIGHHFFTSQGVPDLASTSLDGTGAVAWLKLSATGDTIGPAKLVYRVVTAGGNSHGCAKAAGGDSTSYTATYWFYG